MQARALVIENRRSCAQLPVGLLLAQCVVWLVMGEVVRNCP